MVGELMKSFEKKTPIAEDLEGDLNWYLQKGEPSLPKDCKMPCPPSPCVHIHLVKFRHIQ